MNNKWCFALLAGLALSCGSLNADAGGYRAISLDTPENGIASAYGINDNGQIVLSYMGMVAIWQAGEITTQICGGMGYGINNAGDVIGTRYVDADNRNEGFIYTGGEIRTLAPLDGWDATTPSDINNSGVVTGSCFEDTYAQPLSGFVWQNGATSDLGYVYLQRALGHGVNDLGQVVGFAACQGFLWENGAMTLLDCPADMHGNAAYDINNNGDIVGMTHGDNVELPTVWTNGAAALLGLLPEYKTGVASLINDQGVVAGFLYDDQNLTHAVIWQNGKCVLLDTLGGNRSYVTGINSKGQLVGWADDAAGVQHAVLWEPVPEPASILALLTGLVGMGGAAVRRRR